MKLARKIDESASDVVGYGMVNPMSSTLWRCHRPSTSTEQWTSLLCVGDGDEKPVCVPEDGVFLFLPRFLYVPEACDARIELIPWMDRQP